MSFDRAVRAVVGLALLVASVQGCGEESAGEQPIVDTELTIHNASQFDLLEVRIHDGESYADAPNLLDGELASGDEVLVPFRTYQHVTVLRRKTDVGPIIALTTAEGLEVTGPGFVLRVFDDGFRLVPP